MKTLMNSNQTTSTTTEQLTGQALQAYIKRTNNRNLKEGIIKGQKHINETPKGQAKPSNNAKVNANTKLKTLSDSEFKTALTDNGYNWDYNADNGTIYSDTVTQLYGKTVNTSYDEVRQKTFAYADKAILEQSINDYIDCVGNMLVSKAIKLLQRARITVDYNNMEDIKSEAKCILYGLMVNWTEHTKYSWIASYDEAGQAVLTKEGKPKMVKDTTVDGVVFENWYEMPANMLFMVLADRCEKQLRKYIMGDNNLNNMVALDSIAESATVEDLTEQILLKVDRRGAIEELQGMLTKGQYNALVSFITSDKVTSRNVSMTTPYREMKKAISNGLINPDELRDMLPMLKTSKYLYDEKYSIAVKKGLAQILRKLA